MAGETDSDSEDEDDVVQDFTAANWPLTHEETREELEELMATHRIRPIPVWDENRVFIKPDLYRHHLEEAIIEVHFTLTHWSIASRRGDPGTDAFVGEIDTMQVLIPPQVISRGVPKKRKLKQRLEDRHSQSQMK